MRQHPPHLLPGAGEPRYFQTLGPVNTSAGVLTMIGRLRTHPALRTRIEAYSFHNLGGSSGNRFSLQGGAGAFWQNVLLLGDGGSPAEMPCYLELDPGAEPEVWLRTNGAGTAILARFLGWHYDPRVR
jgi:hypothetical protein